MSRIRAILDLLQLPVGSPERNEIERDIRARLKRQLIFPGSRTSEPDKEARLLERVAAELDAEVREGKTDAARRIKQRETRRLGMSSFRAAVLRSGTDDKSSADVERVNDVSDATAAKHVRAIHAAIIPPRRWRLRSTYLERSGSWTERKLAAQQPRLDIGEERTVSIPEATASARADDAPAEIGRLESDAGAVVFYLSGADVLLRFEGAEQEVDLGNGSLAMELLPGQPDTYRILNLSLDDLDAVFRALSEGDVG